MRKKRTADEAVDKKKSDVEQRHDNAVVPSPGDEGSDYGSDFDADATTTPRRESRGGQSQGDKSRKNSGEVSKEDQGRRSKDQGIQDGLSVT